MSQRKSVSGKYPMNRVKLLLFLRCLLAVGGVYLCVLHYQQDNLAKAVGVGIMIFIMMLPEAIRLVKKERML